LQSALGWYWFEARLSRWRFQARHQPKDWK
jgi:hypothetical protein